MKKLIFLPVLLLLFQCYNSPKYKEGDALCVDGVSVTVMKIHTFIGTGYCEGPVYRCRYVLHTGEIKEQSFCEKELDKLCKQN